MQQVLYPYNINVSLSMSSTVSSVGIFDRNVDTYEALLALSAPGLNSTTPPPFVRIKPALWNYTEGNESATNLSFRTALLKILYYQVIVLGDENYPNIKLFSYIRDIMFQFGTDLLILLKSNLDESNY